MSKVIHRLLNRSGQHSIEYATILILVMAGIIISEPYVIRSWNANMQSWEDTVIDSFDDPLLQAPDVISLPGCSCSWSLAVGCGPIGGCGETEMADQCICTPVGCGASNPFAACPEGTFRCNCDPTCCSTPQSTGLCGADGGCNTGEMQFTFSCGCGPQQTICLPDPACSFDCVAPINPPPNSSACPDIGNSASGCLTQDRNNVLVDTCTGGCDHCEHTCDPPYFIIGGGTGCGTCPAGTVAQGNCATGNCEQDPSCSAGQCLSG